MVGERAIQLRMVRPIFRALPFLAPVAGQAADANFKSPATDAKRRPGFPIAYRIFSSAWDGNCCAAVAAAASPL